MRAAPITCWRPAPKSAAAFASLPYDVFDRAQAYAYVEKHPHSFLAIDRPETAFLPEHDMYADDVYEAAAKLLRERAQDGTLVRDDTPCYYIYRLEQAGHAQVGIVCGASVDEYDGGTIKRHESTTRAKEEDRVRHIRTTGAQTGPIFLTYRDNYAISFLVSAAMNATPLYDFTDEQGVRQSVWRVARPAAVEALEAAFATVPCAYIADGHHRAASAVRVCKERREAAGADQDGEKPYDLFLAVLFPASQLKVLAYNRVVADLGGLDADELVQKMEAAGFEVGPATEEAPQPTRHGEYALYVGGSWRRMRFAATDELDAGNPVAALDAQVLQERVLAPLLGIDDPRANERIRFVGGIEGTERLEELAGAGGVAFALWPTSVDELMAVSDAGMLMPPKSTWFEPKLRSGLFIRRF